MLQKLKKDLNAKDKETRLNALADLIRAEKEQGIMPEFNENDANNHIHTIYSFSPYSPTLAAYKAYSAGLKTMGIMDHDSLSGAEEFIIACDILGTSATVGLETRVHLKKGFGRINNPDQEDYVYIAAHGIPHQNINALNDYMSFYRSRRNVRNRKMTEKINDRFKEFDIKIDFDKDVYPISMAKEGGSITERHLMYALAKKIFQKFETGENVIKFLTDSLKINVSEKIKGFLSDKENPHLLYDLLGVLKSDTKFFYIPATDESPDLEEFVDIAKCMGAITAYAYLGDIGESVTGDKKAQTFEDAFLEDLLKVLKESKIDAVAYMPTRNTEKQLDRLKDLCKKYEFFQISGEDINSPRQKFACPMLANPKYSHLIQSTWALIGHEKCATKNLYDGMFTAHSKKRFPDLDYRIKVYSQIGKNF